jgi:hypothetical protein
VPRCVVCLLGLGHTLERGAALSSSSQWAANMANGSRGCATGTWARTAGFTTLKSCVTRQFSCTTFNRRGRHPELAERTCQSKQIVRECGRQAAAAAFRGVLQPGERTAEARSAGP